MESTPATRAGRGRRRHASIFSVTLQRSSWVLWVHGSSAKGASGGDGGDDGGDGGGGDDGGADRGSQSRESYKAISEAPLFKKA
eukprot:scaffold27076_cov67-Phaeocystis_antarctica.AAC.1